MRLRRCERSLRVSLGLTNLSVNTVDGGLARPVCSSRLCSPGAAHHPSVPSSALGQGLPSECGRCALCHDLSAPFFTPLSWVLGQRPASTTLRCRSCQHTRLIIEDVDAKNVAEEGVVSMAKS